MAPPGKRRQAAVLHSYCRSGAVRLRRIVGCLQARGWQRTGELHHHYDARQCADGADSHRARVCSPIRPSSWSPGQSASGSTRPRTTARSSSPPPRVEPAAPRRCLFCEPLTNGLQLAVPCGARFRIAHLEALEGIEQDSGDNEPGIVLVVGRNDVPRGELGAGRAQAFIVGLHVLLPEIPLLNIRQAEFPVLLRFIDPRQKALALLLLRQMQVELDDAGFVAEQM